MEAVAPEAYYYGHEVYAQEKRPRDEVDPRLAPSPRRFRPVPFDRENLPDAPPLPPKPAYPPKVTRQPFSSPPAPPPSTPAAPRPPSARPLAPRANAAAITPMAPRYNVVSQLDNTAARISISDLLRTSPEFRAQMQQFLEDMRSPNGPRGRRPAEAPGTAPKAHLFQYGEECPDGNLASNLAELAEPEVFHAADSLRPPYTPGVPSVARIQCKVFGMPVVAIVDSGASHSVLSQSVIRKLQLHSYVEKAATILHTAGGQEEMPWGMLRDVPVTVGRLKLVLDALPVTQATNYAVLLGNDWLVQAACQMSWDTCKMRFMVSPGEYDEVDFDVVGRLRQPPMVDLAVQQHFGPPCRQQHLPHGHHSAEPFSTPVYTVEMGKPSQPEPASAQSAHSQQHPVTSAEVTGQPSDSAALPSSPATALEPRSSVVNEPQSQQQSLSTSDEAKPDSVEVPAAAPPLLTHLGNAVAPAVPAPCKLSASASQPEQQAAQLQHSEPCCTPVPAPQPEQQAAQPQPSKSCNMPAPASQPEQQAAQPQPSEPCKLPAPASQPEQQVEQPQPSQPCNLPAPASQPKQQAAQLQLSKPCNVPAPASQPEQQAAQPKPSEPCQMPALTSQPEQLAEQSQPSVPLLPQPCLPSPEAPREIVPSAAAQPAAASSLLVLSTEVVAAMHAYLHTKEDAEEALLKSPLSGLSPSQPVQTDEHDTAQPKHAGGHADGNPVLLGVTPACRGASEPEGDLPSLVDAYNSDEEYTYHCGHHRDGRPRIRPAEYNEYDDSPPSPLVEDYSSSDEDVPGVITSPPVSNLPATASRAAHQRSTLAPPPDFNGLQHSPAVFLLPHDELAASLPQEPPSSESDEELFTHASVAPTFQRAPAPPGSYPAQPLTPSTALAYLFHRPLADPSCALPSGSSLSPSNSLSQWNRCDSRQPSLQPGQPQHQ
ncbi:hypothetical protein N2152v2_008280 [Parachlorella kessleri]